ncbi:GDSL esterase/lipase At4g10955-like isoform X2 [Tasmannia lanceolata]|uniref:GDSL esterase/lipase At4g10955-like isoform X2 n=1 Tax=Tasmannia lanceolata TaxID=3420 RepID=UPI004063292D
MAPEKDTFDLSGPTDLTHIDWNIPAHRRSVAASLVQGVYVLERDRQKNRLEHEALAPAWWEFFHFQLLRKLVDDADLSIFGAIYELKSPTSDQNHSAAQAPRFVIAFRGTIIKLDSFLRDLKLDLLFILNAFHKTSRSKIAMQAVRNLVSDVGNSNIWLAGHSLGSALAMHTGKNMAIVGDFLKTFLFDPPFVSAPIERIKTEKLKKRIRIASSLITAGLTVAMKGRHASPSSENSFTKLSEWSPHLFVNPADIICSRYVGYFKHREEMEKIGLGGIERLATQNSIRDLFLTAFGRESKLLHLIPSAKLTVNLTPSPYLRRAHGIRHGIRQWWRLDLNLECKQYYYK